MTTRAWKNVKLRRDLFDRLAARASAESRSVAGQLDHLLSRALESAPNTSASSGGGPAEAVIPGESGRGAGVALPGDAGADEPPISRGDPASVPSRTPDLGERMEQALYHPEAFMGQITVDEAITRCPVCNDALDEDRNCVDPECSSHSQP